MYVISVTQCRRPLDVRETVRTACMTHTDVLVLLLLALALASCCCVRIVTGLATWPVVFFFALQAVFCMLACPTLSIALRLAPSAFLARYLRGARASLLLKAIACAILAQTLLVFWNLL